MPGQTIIQRITNVGNATFNKSNLGEIWTMAFGASRGQDIQPRDGG